MNDLFRLHNCHKYVANKKRINTHEYINFHKLRIIAVNQHEPVINSIRKMYNSFIMFDIHFHQSALM